MAKELNLGVIFYGVATKALAEITKLETRVKQLNTGFVASGKAATGSSKAMATQAKGAKGLANEMSLVGKKIGQVSGGIQRLTAAMKVTASYGLAATAIFGVINAFKAGTAAIFDFDQALKNLQAITGAIDAEIAVLGDKIREVAARTKYSAKEVSDATVLLGQAGFDAAESLDAIEAVAMLATGTLTDMATTADLLTTAIRAFGLETSESGRVADIFATAVNKSKLTIDKLRTAFNYLGPVASNAGLSLEETAASTMVLANAGLRGSTIGTGFRQVLARLIAPSEKLRLAFRAAGADLEKLNPLTNDFSVVLDELSKVVTHSGIAIRLFGMRASAAAVAIAKGNDKYKEMLDYTYRVGVATEMAEKQMEGLAVMAKNLGDKLHNLAIALGEGGIAGAFRIVLNILRPLVDLMTLAADNVVGRFVVAVTSLTVVITALTLAARYLVIQLSAVALGYTVAAVKAMAAAEGANLLLIAFTALGAAFSRLGVFLKAYPLVAIIALLASLYTGFKLWRQSVAEQTIELQKQSIMLAKAGFQLEAYAEQLDKAKEGSREYEAIMERLLNDYPELADAVDLTTMKWKDQGEALKELIDLKHDEYVGKLIELVGEYGDKIDSLRVKIALHALTIGKVTKDTKEFWEETKRGEYAFPGAEKLAGKIIEAFGTAWDFMKFSTKEASDFYKKKLLGMAEDTKEVTETIELQQETIKTIAGRLKKYGIDAESTIGVIAASIYALGEKSMEAAIKMAAAVKQYLGTSIAPKVDADERFTILATLLDKKWHAWGEFYQKLDWLRQNELVAAFEAAEKKITKERETLEVRYAVELANAKTRVETEAKIQIILADIRADALEKFKKSLDSRKKTYLDFFKELEALSLKADDKKEEAEIARAGIAHDKRLKAFVKELKDRFDLEKDYATELDAYTKKSEKTRRKEVAQIQAKYAKQRLENEVSTAIETEKLMLEIAKKGVDERVAAGIDTIAEGNRKKAELEVQYHWTVAQIYTDIFNNIKAKYGEDTKEYVNALNDKLKATAEFAKAQAKLITVDLKDLKESEKILESFIDRVMTTWADAFADMFKGSFEDFQDLMRKMSDLFIDTLTAMAAKAATSKIMVSIDQPTTTSTNANWGGGTGGGGWGYGAIVAMVLGSVVSVLGAKSDRKKEAAARERALAKAYHDITKEIDRMLESLTPTGEAFRDLNDQFNAYWYTLSQLGASMEQLANIEEKRAEAVAHLREEMLQDFIVPLKDVIASFTLGPGDYERYKLDVWYDEQIEAARLLGAEAVTLLREAYELSKLQYTLKLQETLLGESEGYEQIIASIGMTPVEMQLYALVQASEAAGDVFLDVVDEIAFLYGEADRYASSIHDLTVELADLQSSYDKITQGYADYKAMYQTLGDMFNIGVEGGKFWVDYMYSEWSAGISDWYNQWIYLSDDLIAELHSLFIAREAYEAAQYTIAPLLLSIPAEIESISAALSDLLLTIAELEEQLASATGLEQQAYLAQLEALKASVSAGWTDIIQNLTLSEQELAMLALDEWYVEQLIAAEVLSLALDDLNLAYDLQLQAIMNLGQAIDETIASIDDMIESLTGGALAPVQSAEYYMDKYAGFLEAAMAGTAGAVDELLGFIPEYLDFMGDYGGDYAGLTAAIVAQLENLKLTLPGLQHGGLTSGLSFAGEAGPEWVVPTYEPQRSSFLEDVGMDPVAIGRTIAGELLASGGRDIHVHVNINQREIGNATARELRSNTELIEAVRRTN